MLLLRVETPLEKQEELLREALGQELTPRQKFYLALAEACATVRDGSELHQAP
jgi:hypothetical protein